MAVWRKIIVSGSDADLSNITSTGDIKVRNESGNYGISSSGLLFISTSDATTNPYLTVLIDTSSGRLYYTGSYGGGSGGGVSDFTELTNIPSDLYSSSLQTLGNITSSGDISASGDIRLGQNIYFANDTRIISSIGSVGIFKHGGSAKGLKVGSLFISDNYSDSAPTNGLFVKGSSKFSNVTASGDISASKVIAGTGSLGKIVLGKGNIDSSLTNAKLSIHSSENNETLFSLKNLTNILFDIDATGKIRHDVNDIPFSFGENQQISLGFSNTSKAFQIVNGEIINENLLFSVSQSGEVTIGNINDPTLLKVAGVVSASSISASGIIQATTFVGDGSNLTGIGSVDALNEFTSSIQSEVNGLKLATSSYAILNNNVLFNHISASGNISASGTITASNLSGINTGDQDLTPYSTLVQLNSSSSILRTDINNKVENSLTASFAVTGSNVLFGNITASALKINQISASSLTASNVLINEDLNLDGNFIFQGVQFSEAEAVQFTGSTTFGSGSNNTHTFTGSIIGSGSSFNFIGDTFEFNSNTLLQSFETSSLLKTASFQELLDNTGSFVITGSDQRVLFGDITSSGNISASGDLVLSGTASINKLIISTLPDGPLDRNYTNAKLSIHSELGDLFSLYKGTNTHNKLFNISSSGEVSASNNIIAKNFVLDKHDSSKILFKDSTGGANTTHSLQYNKWKASSLDGITIENPIGGILLSGSVTASNDISASGIVIANQIQAFYNGHLRDIINFSASLGLLKLGNDDTDTIIRGKNDLILSSSLNVSNSIITTNITASGGISASGFLHFKASDAEGNFNNVVLIDTSSGRLYYTGSYGGGGTFGAGGSGGVLYNTDGNNIALDLFTINNFDNNVFINSNGGELSLTFGTPPEPAFISFYSPTSIDNGFNTDRFNLENDNYTLRVDYNLNGTAFNEGTIFVDNEQVTTFTEGDGSELIAISSTNFPSLASGSHTFIAKLNTTLADGTISDDKQISRTLTLSKINPGTPTITKTANILPPEALYDNSTRIEEGATGSIVYNVNSGNANNWSPREITIDSNTGQYTFSNTNGGSDDGIYASGTSDVTINVNPTGTPLSKYIFQNWISPEGANDPVLTRRFATSPTRVSYLRNRSFRYGTGSFETLGDFNALGGADYLRDLAIWTQTHGTIEYNTRTKSQIQNLGDFNLDATTADNSGRYFYLVFDKNAGTLNKITNVDTNLNEIGSFSGPHILDNYHMYISNIRYSSYNFNLTFN